MLGHPRIPNSKTGNFESLPSRSSAGIYQKICGCPYLCFIRQVFREDSADLFGFLNAGERDFFDLLTKVSGIGKKTAERIVVKLRDKVSSFGLPGATLSSGNSDPLSSETAQEAIAALVTLGFKTPDPRKAVERSRQTCGPSASTEDLVKAALR